MVIGMKGHLSSTECQSSSHGGDVEERNNTEHCESLWALHSILTTTVDLDPHNFSSIMYIWMILISNWVDQTGQIEPVCCTILTYILIFYTYTI